MSKTSQPSDPSLSRKIVIVDDHPVFRKGLAQLIDSEPDLKVCGSAGTAAQGLKAIEKTDPDLVLVDITLPDKSGLELIKEIPKVSKRTKILVVSMHDEALYANRVLALGGDGYIMKQEDVDEIVHAIRDVLNGHIYVSEEVLAGGSKTAKKPNISQGRERPIDRLSDSELEMLELLGHGKSEQEILRQLDWKPQQLEAAYFEMIKKLKVRHQNGLMRYAVCWVERGDA
jgi:DNA-binding NarL/FixJ family response regulator